MAMIAAYFHGWTDEELRGALRYQQDGGMPIPRPCVIGCGGKAYGYRACAKCLQAEIDRRAKGKA